MSSPDDNSGLSLVDGMVYERGKMVDVKYAVVIVTYNREKLLRDCVRHVEAQMVPADKVIIVNNASTDGTSAYLQQLGRKSNIYQIIECPENVGGAGGFAKGIAQAMACDVDCLLLIDDDAMLTKDYMYCFLAARSNNPRYQAFAGSVKTNHEFDLCHRRKLSKIGLLFRNCPISMYKRRYFTCDIVSFCGMLLDLSLVRMIGLPHAEYFIWNDDAEYSLRIRRYSRFLVAPEAVLEHRTVSTVMQSRPRKYEWRDYYAIRNRILLVKEHGTVLDRVVNAVHLFFHVLFRNWLFGIIRAGNYDWKYEKKLVKEAIKDSRSYKTFVC